MILRFFLLYLIVSVIAGCSINKIRIAAKPQTPFFVAMPINDGVPEPIGPAFYHKLIEYLEHRNYKIVTKPNQGYILKTTIHSLTPIQHFISQDVVLLHKLVELKATCSIYNFAHTLIAEKTFCFETIISKAQSPLQQDSYTMYTLHGMLEHQLQSVEQFCRRHLQ